MQDVSESHLRTSEATVAGALLGSSAGQLPVSIHCCSMWGSPSVRAAAGLARGSLDVVLKMRIEGLEGGCAGRAARAHVRAQFKFQAAVDSTLVQTWLEMMTWLYQTEFLGRNNWPQ